MNQSIKMHRTCAVWTAVIMLLAQTLHIAASLSGPTVYRTPVFWVQVVGDALNAVMLSAILFRGRKDAAAGVVFLITAIVPALLVYYHLFSVALSAELRPYFLLCAVSCLVLATFRALSAGECLSKGKVSAGKGRVLFWLLPVLCFGVELWAQMLLSFFNGIHVGETVVGSLIYVTPQWLGPILMGVALSAREKR